MGWIVAIVVGALVGWLASKMMAGDKQQGPMMAIIVGIVGGILGGWLFGDVLGWGGELAADGFDFMGIVWGAVGAFVLVWLLKMLKVVK